MQSLKKNRLSQEEINLKYVGKTGDRGIVGKPGPQGQSGKIITIFDDINDILKRIDTKMDYIIHYLDNNNL